MKSFSAETGGDLAQTLERMAQLERRGWWSWGAALVIIFVLTAGITVLARPAVRETLGNTDFELAARALFPIVVLFALFAVRQQMNITRLRQELAVRIGMMATMEVLRAPTAQGILERQNRRKAQRYFFDQRVKLKLDDETIYGRIRDISEIGVGVVIPRSLPAGSRAVVEFNAGEGESIVADVVLKHAHGFYHGFEFAELPAALAESVKKACRVALDLPENVSVQG